MLIIAELKDDKGNTLAVVTAPPKEFKTGSKGFYGNARTEIDGKRYTVQVQLVEVGSKTKETE